MCAKKKAFFILIVVFIGFSNIFFFHQGKNLREETFPLTADDNTLIYCNFENSLESFSGETGITNGNWKYETTNPLVGSSSVYLAGENRNHIKWDYGSALAEGTIECFFLPINISFVDGAKYILNGGKYYDGSFGVYHRKDGTLFAQFNANGAWHTIQSSENIHSDQLYHIAFTWGSRGIELWLNGFLVAADETITIGLASFTQYYGIGNTPMGSSTYSSYGYWDEFQLSNIQRSSFPQNVTDYTPPDIPDENNTPKVPWDVNLSNYIWILPLIALIGVVFLVGIIFILIVEEKKRMKLKD